jgi:hypothetical protein
MAVLYITNATVRYCSFMAPERKTGFWYSILKNKKKKKQKNRKKKYSHFKPFPSSLVIPIEKQQKPKTKT